MSAYVRGSVLNAAETRPALCAQTVEFRVGRLLEVAGSVAGR